MSFTALNEQIRSLRNELLELNSEPLPFKIGYEKDIEQEIEDLQNEASFYSTTLNRLTALYPNIITLPDADTISKRDYLKRYNQYEASQAIRMIVQELTTRFSTPVQFETTYINKRKQSAITQAAREHTELNQIVFDAMRQSEMWLKDHPTEDSKHIQNLARSTWNTGNYTLTRNGVESFINHLKRIGAIAPTSVIGKLRNQVMERMNNV